MTEQQRALWDEAADGFDDQPDHGLRDASVRRAWADLMADVMPPPPARVLDLGSGTGSLAVLLAGQGYDVVGIDLAPRMVELATRKADRHGVRVRFGVGDAADPDVDASVDVVLVRHVAWTLRDLPGALGRWVDLLVPGGRLVLVEGLWHTGEGLALQELLPLVESRAAHVSVRRLSDEAALWGRPVTDERYVLVARV